MCLQTLKHACSSSDVTADLEQSNNSVHRQIGLVLDNESDRGITVSEGHRSSKAKAKARKHVQLRKEVGTLIKYYHGTGGDTDANVQRVML